MPKFVIEREIPGAGSLTDAQLREVSQKSVNVLRGMGPEIQWLHSYVTGDKVYCVYLAADEATIQEHARRVGVPANLVSAVRRLLAASSAEEAPLQLREACDFLRASVPFRQSLPAPVGSRDGDAPSGISASSMAFST